MNSIAERVAFHLLAAAATELDLLDASSCQEHDSGRRGGWPQQQRSRTLSEGEKYRNSSFSDIYLQRTETYSCGN